MIALRDLPTPRRLSARSRSGSVSPPKPSAPIVRSSRRVKPSQSAVGVSQNGKHRRAAIEVSEAGGQAVVIFISKPADNCYLRDELSASPLPPKNLAIQQIPIKLTVPQMTRGAGPEVSFVMQSSKPRIESQFAAKQLSNK